MKSENFKQFTDPEIIRNLHREENIVFCDIETSGLDPGEHEILEIGFVGLNQEKYPPLSFKFKMCHPERASSDALKINHYSEEKWKNAKPINESFDILSALYENCVLAGWNFGFDISFIKQHIPRKYHTWDYHFLDVMSMYKILYLHHIPSFLKKEYSDLEKKQFLSSELKLVNACKAFKIDTKQYGRPHEALVDALMTRELYIHLVLDILNRDMGYFLSAQTASVMREFPDIGSIV